MGLNFYPLISTLWYDKSKAFDDHLWGGLGNMRQLLGLMIAVGLVAGCDKGEVELQSPSSSPNAAVSVPVKEYPSASSPVSVPVATSTLPTLFDPMLMKISGAIVAMDSPDSTGKEVLSLNEGDTVAALQASGDWLGVAANGFSNLVWIPKNRLSQDREWPVTFGQFDIHESYTLAPLLDVILRSELVQGASRARVERLLGPASIEEDSRNISGNPSEFLSLKVSRYENNTSHLSITWSDDSTLFKYQLLDSRGLYDSDVSDYRDSSILSRPIMSGIFGVGILARSVPLSFTWKADMDQSANFVIGASKSAIVVSSEYSGYGTDNWRIQGLNVTDGHTLWREDFGYGKLMSALSEDGQVIGIAHLVGNAGVSESHYRLVFIHTASGKKAFDETFTVDGELSGLSLYASAGIAGVSYDVNRDGEKSTTYLEAREFSTGRKLWEKRFDGTGQLLPQQGDAPSFVLQLGEREIEGASLTGIDPRSGKSIWLLQERASGTPESNARRTTGMLTGSKEGYWTRNLDKLILVDARTGHTRLKLLESIGVNYEQLNSSYIFRQQETYFYGSHGPSYMGTEMIDARTGRTLWSLSGLADRGVVDGDVVYYRMDEKRTVSSNVKTGSLHWIADWTAEEPVIPYRGSLYVMGYQDLFVVDAQSGRSISRASNVGLDGAAGYTLQHPFGVISVWDGKMYVGSTNGYVGSIPR